MYPKRLLFTALLFIAASISNNLLAGTVFKSLPGLPSNVLVHAADMKAQNYTDPEARLPFLLPMYFIYPDGALTAEQASELVAELGLDGELSKLTGSIFVINPADGEKYDPVADYNVYETVFNIMRVFVNLKVVGIGKGATFVNQVIAPIAGEVAGIVSIDGAAARKGGAKVPAYIAGKNAAKVAKAYITADKARLLEPSKTKKVYANMEEPLLEVVVNTAKNQSLSDIFADAWESLLSRNIRSSNLGHTNYAGALLGQYGEYELEPYPMFDRLGIRREICATQIKKRSKLPVLQYLWYEYIPAQAETAAERSVPLVVLLHGHNNDPRTQAESSGFLELAAKEGFIVAELEWQGKPDYAYMDDGGIEVTIREIMKRYPQIDPSRVYAEGMSAGGFAATALGVRKPYLFAAVGAHSGGLFNETVTLGFPFQDRPGLEQAAAFLSGNVTMPYFSIGGSADEGVPFNKIGEPNGSLLTDAWLLYMEYNGLEKPAALDFGQYPVFGIPLENRHRVETIKPHAMEIGDVLKDGRPIIRIVEVENFGHSNYVPGAAEMWEFFSHWSRDQKTFESVWND